MKLRIKKQVLLENLNKVSKAISTKNLVPALAGIKFDLTDKGLTLTASDNEITIETFVENIKDNMEVEETGSVIIQGKYILDIVRKIQDTEINISVLDEVKVLITTDTIEYNINGINKKEYPNISLENSKNPVKLNNKVLKDLVNQTSFATSTDDSRPQLTGINIKIDGNNLECNATDSYRLAKKTIELQDNEETLSFNIIVPSKNIIEFTRIINDDDDTLINIFSNKVLFETKGLKFQSKLITGAYPNTSNLIPKDNLFSIKLNGNDLYNVIDRVSILTSDRDKNIVTLETNGNTLTMNSSSIEMGSGKETMTVEKVGEGDIKISFSARYMMEALKVLTGEQVEIKFVGTVNPIVIQDEDKNLVQLVLPIRTY